MAQRKLDTEKLLAFLTTPRSVKEIAAQFGVSSATAKKYVTDLTSKGKVNKSGVQNTGERGRPADLFVASAQGTVTAPPTITASTTSAPPSA